MPPSSRGASRPCERHPLGTRGAIPTYRPARLLRLGSQRQHAPVIARRPQADDAISNARSRSSPSHRNPPIPARAGSRRWLRHWTPALVTRFQRVCHIRRRFQPMPSTDALNRCLQPMPSTHAVNPCLQPMPLSPCAYNLHYHHRTATAVHRRSPFGSALASRHRFAHQLDLCYHLPRWFLLTATPFVIGCAVPKQYREDRPCPYLPPHAWASPLPSPSSA
jgi:hypothetical protein